MQKLNKRGDFTDPLVKAILLFIFATGFLVIAYVIPQISGGLLSANLNDTSQGTQAISSLENFGTLTIQRGFILISAGLILSMFVTAVLSNFHPIFLFLYVITLTVSTLLSIYLANAYDLIITNPAISSFVESQPLFSFFMNNFLVITIVSGVITMIILFTRFKDSPGGNFA